jgi:hypothetical protein
MSVPVYYIVADGNAYALDENGVAFGAPVCIDGSVDWEGSYDFNPNEEDVEYVARMCHLLTEAASMS